MNSQITLVAINSTYQHASLGIRYLYANLKELQNFASIKEFTIQKNPLDIVEALLKDQPLIIGFGIYIWNIQIVSQVIISLKKIAPNIKIVIGGPEVSYEYHDQEIFHACDHLICGEADLKFYQLCKRIIDNEANIQKIFHAEIPNIQDITLPYDLYTDEDLKNRFVYVEASRGCPYKCEYCLSSLDKSVRQFNLNDFLSKISILFDRGARQFKFIDRTFNLSPSFCVQILSFFESLKSEDLFLHFEMVPDRLPAEIKPFLEKFKPGQVQFEIGLQTLNPVVAQNVSRKNNLAKVAENFKYLKTHTGIHTHADLIAGLPGEDIESFANGFDQLYSWQPDEIQVGILKRLKGTPIIRHESSFNMIYSSTTPFQILKTNTMSFDEMQLMSRFSKYWDMYNNSGQFNNFMFILFEQRSQFNQSYFKTFMQFTLFLQTRFEKNYGISLDNQFHAAVDFLTSQLKMDRNTACKPLLQDYINGNRTYIPHFLRIEGYDPLELKTKKKQSQLNDPVETDKKVQSTIQRQNRHLAKK